MLWLEQLEFTFELARGRDPHLESRARALLRSVGARTLLQKLRVEWNPRLRSAAGRAAFHEMLVSLNPQLRAHGAEEIERTLRHELAHLIAHLRAGRRRISPHGVEWRQACRDLGIADERRCHSLPFSRRSQTRRFLYRCASCGKDFLRVRRLRRAMACLECCRRQNRGRYSKQFQLRLVRVLSN